MLRAVILTQYRRVTDRQTDRQTDGIAIASTALALRALGRAVKPVRILHSKDFYTVLSDYEFWCYFYNLKLSIYRGAPFYRIS